ncbi:hypothetical protein [Sessilibacter sp. MAH4]
MTLNIPKLEELFENKTVLILGAGASKDYGFPLWAKLKEELLDIFRSPSVPEVSADGSANWWIDKLNNMDETQTVDTLAPDAPDEYFDRFRLALALIVARYESLDNNTGWVESFATKFAEMLLRIRDRDKINQAVTNFTAITLNYDRSFNRRFGLTVVEKFRAGLEGHGRNYKKYHQEVFEAHLYMVLHPHGSLGSTGEVHVNINDSTYQGSSSHLRVNYGDTNEIIKLFNEQGAIPNVTSIDDMSDGNNPCYFTANSKMHAKNAICIGLSDIGVKNCKLDFKNIQTVYYSGANKIYDNFIPLNIHAAPLIEAM